MVWLGFKQNELIDRRKKNEEEEEEKDDAICFQLISSTLDINTDIFKEVEIQYLSSKEKQNNIEFSLLILLVVIVFFKQCVQCIVNYILLQVSYHQHFFFRLFQMSFYDIDTY